MPVRMVSDDDENEEEDDNNENVEECGYDYLIGERIYVGRNDNTGLYLYKSPSVDADVHAELSADDLEEADYYVGVGERLKVVDDVTWLKLKYAKPVWLPLDGNDIDYGD